MEHKTLSSDEWSAACCLGGPVLSCSHRGFLPLLLLRLRAIGFLTETLVDGALNSQVRPQPLGRSESWTALGKAVP